jgi:hypothetical protein
LGKQREVTGAQGCATKAQGRESVIATEPQEPKAKDLDPGLRRDDEVGADDANGETTKIKMDPGFRRDDGMGRTTKTKLDCASRRKLIPTQPSP